MIYVIIGPTGSGKTEVANKIATILNCDLINADAFQIYKDMNIGTNKISMSDPMYKRYHLLDILAPNQTYNVKQYQEDARKALNSCLINNENVVIVGGTGLYIRALLYDYSFNNENTNIDPEYEKMDNHSLYELLNKLDSDEAKKLHENNRKRVIRALMLIKNNNESKSELLAKQSHKYVYPEKDISILYISPDRETLYQNINARVEHMIDKGLIEEVENLSIKYDLSLTAKQGIGYKEVLDYLDGNISKEECIELIQKRTRNYAKRQETFFKHQFINYKKFSSKEEIDNYININIKK